MFNTTKGLIVIIAVSVVVISSIVALETIALYYNLPFLFLGMLVWAVLGFYVICSLLEKRQIQLWNEEQNRLSEDYLRKQELRRLVQESKKELSN